MSKHIGIVTNQFPAISETFIVNKVLGLVEAGMRVTVCVGTSESDYDYYRKILSIQKIRIININSKLQLTLNLLIHPVKAVLWFIGLNKTKGAFNSLILLLKGFLVKLQGFDIIHFEFSGIGIAHLDLIEFYKPAKIFVSCRGSAEYVAPLIDPLRKANLKRLFEKIDRIHCVSRAMSHEINKYGATTEKIFINRPAIKTSVEFDAKRGSISESHISVLSVGRLTFQKGYIYGLKAIKDLVVDYPDIVYKIVGSGEDLAEIKFFVEFFGLHRNVILFGALPNEEVVALMLTSDIFLLTSVYEGIANVVLEAMAAALPIVSTRSGGMDEIIVDEFNGLLVDCYDHFSVSKAIKRIISDKILQRELGYNALRTINEDFTIEQQLDIFIKEYNY